MSETRWNGDLCQARRITAVVTDSDGVEHVVMEWPAVEWPRRHGKNTLQRQLRGEITVEAAADRAFLLDALRPAFAAAQARVDRALSLYADALQVPFLTARQQHDDVLRILEAAGIADGYGRLTITQPVRLPVAPPTRWRRP